MRVLYGGVVVDDVYVVDVGVLLMAVSGYHAGCR